MPIIGAAPNGRRFLRILVWFVVNREAYGEGLRHFVDVEFKL